MNKPNQNYAFPPAFLVGLILLSLTMFTLPWSSVVFGQPRSLEKGQPIPVVTLIGKEGRSVALDTLKGRITLMSIVPQLNTPVCDEQTHRFSEQNEGLDEFITLVTVSTNTHTDQAKFSEEAKIHNITFLSDAPDFHFGRQTGLLLDEIDILHRAVIVLDANSIIRYMELVPMSQLPDFEQAYRVVRSLISHTS